MSNSVELAPGGARRWWRGRTLVGSPRSWPTSGDRDGLDHLEWVIEHEQLLEHPEKWRAFYGDTPTWVFTHRDLPSFEGADIRSRRVTFDRSRAMVEAAGDKNIWIVGGGELVGRFTDAGLLDEGSS